MTTVAACMICIAIAAPTFFLLGRFVRLDSQVSHERADISAALKWSVR